MASYGRTRTMSSDLDAALQIIVQQRGRTRVCRPRPTAEHAAACESESAREASASTSVHAFELPRMPIASLAVGRS
jgi:hypothetical protein